jgi:hypothetical protein
MRPARATQLTVIEGGAQPKPRLLRLPRTVVGPSPFNADDLIAYRIAEQDVRVALENRRRQPVLDLWSMVIGKLPPIPSISKWKELAEELAQNSFFNAHAAFRGMRRPIGDDDYGFDHVAFISKPRVRLRYVPDMVCVAEPEEIPDDVVLATYVKLDFPEGRRNGRPRTDVPISGLITHWELVESDSADSLLPVHSEERYRQRLW